MAGASSGGLVPAARPASPWFARAALAVHRRTLGAPPQVDAGDRPPGVLVWLHAAEPGLKPALADLAARLVEEDGVAAVVTEPAPHGAPLVGPSVTSRSGVVERAVRGAPGLRALDAAWRPDLLAWAGGAMRPTLVAAPHRPTVLLDAAPARRLLGGRGTLVPGLARVALGRVRAALATEPAGAERLVRHGVPRVAVMPPLEAVRPVLPCNERERRDLALALGARPVWLALDLPWAEVPAVLEARSIAARGAHRLLLILALREGEDANAVELRLAAEGLRVARRAGEEEPRPETQVWLAESSAEAGLWLRLAPLTYIGGTLAKGTAGRHPFDAAALGSALIHGPRTAPHDRPWARLAQAGAARLVTSGAELGAAVDALLAPDRPAAMATGGWDVVTAGADTANRAIEMIRDALDEAGG